MALADLPLPVCLPCILLMPICLGLLPQVSPDNLHRLTYYPTVHPVGLLCLVAAPLAEHAASSPLQFCLDAHHIWNRPGLVQATMAPCCK